MTGPDVAVIGCGDLGLSLVGRLVDRGTAVSAYDRRTAAVQAAAALGASPAAGLDEAVRGTGKAVCIAVATEDDVRDVAYRCAPHLGTGAVMVLHSTVTPAFARGLGDELATRDVALVEAALCLAGGDMDSAVTAIVGAGDSDVARLSGLLHGIADRVVHVGPLGSASVAKLANNVMLLGSLFYAELAFELAAVSGVEEHTMLDVVATCTGRSWITDNWGRQDARATDHWSGDAAGAYESMVKDLRLASAQWRRCGLGHPPFDAIAAQLPDLLARRTSQRATEAGGRRPRGGSAP